LLGGCVIAKKRATTPKLNAFQPLLPMIPILSAAYSNPLSTRCAAIIRGTATLVEIEVDAYVE
jgi:hypothetical protein